MRLTDEDIVQAPKKSTRLTDADFVSNRLSPSQGGIPIGIDVLKESEDIARREFNPANAPWYENIMAGGGKGLMNIHRGVRQMGSAFGGPEAFKAVQEDIAESRQLDKPLQKTPEGMVGEVLGTATAAAPTVLIPGAMTIPGAMATGAGIGFLEPTLPGESKAVNAALGAAGGVLGQGLGKGLNRILFGPAKTALSEEGQRLAAMAAQEGIPLGAADMTGSKVAKNINAVFENLPFTASKEAETNAIKQAMFNRAVLKRAGIDADKALPDVLSERKGMLGKAFEEIANNNTLTFNDNLAGTLRQIEAQAGRRLTPDQAKAVSNTVEDIFKQTETSTGYPAMAGTNYQGWRSELGRLAKGTDTQAHYFGQIKKALDKEFSNQISGMDAAMWNKISREYGNLKTILRAMGGANIAEGNISPAQLMQAITANIGREGKALGRGDLTELAKIGELFLKKQVPDSGTAQRAFYQNLMTGHMIPGPLTGGAAYLTTGDPSTALMATGGALVLPRLLQAIGSSAPVRNAFVRGITGQPLRNSLGARALEQGFAGAGSNALRPYPPQQ